MEQERLQQSRALPHITLPGSGTPTTKGADAIRGHASGRKGCGPTSPHGMSGDIMGRKEEVEPTHEPRAGWV